MDLHPDTYLGQTAVKLLAGFSDPDRREFLSHGHVVEHQLHDRILQEGDLDLHLYLVLTGEVSVWRRGVRVAALGPGDVLNETKIFLPRPNHASALAEQHAAVLRISRTQVLQFFTTKPERLLKIFVLNIVAILAQKLEVSENQMIERDARAETVMQEPV